MIAGVKISFLKMLCLGVVGLCNGFIVLVKLYRIVECA